MIPAATSPAPSISLIIEVTAAVTEIPIDRIVGDKRRFRDAVRARHVIYFIAKHHGYSLPRIGKRLGGRDHTTVLYGVRRIKGLILWDLQVSATIATVQELISKVECGEACLRLPIERTIPAPAPKARRLAPQPSIPPDVGVQQPNPIVSEMLRLHELGWSVRGLSRRFGRPPKETARIVGAEWWAGPRDDAMECTP